MAAQSLSRMRCLLMRLQADTEGQDLIEYALLVGFMVVAIWAFFPTSIFPSISNIFNRLVSTASVLVP